MDQAVAQDRRWLAAIRVAVCIFSALVGGFFGLLAAVLYQLEITRTARPQLPELYYWVGPLSGILSGIAVAVLWFRWMDRWAHKHALVKPVSTGGKLGILAGSISAFFVHSSLISAEAIYRSFHLEMLLVGPTLGLVFGVPAGYVVGLVAGSLYGLVFRRLNRTIRPQ